MWTRKTLKTERQNKRDKKGKSMGTDHHQWLFNEVVVAMVTRLYEALPETRPCPPPVWCDSMSACMCLPNAAMLACLTMSSGRLEGCESDWRDQAVIRCYHQCSDQIFALSLRFGYGSAVSPDSLSVPTPQMTIHGWLHVQLQSQPWPFF